jgi:hypothetical protein
MKHGGPGTDPGEHLQEVTLSNHRPRQLWPAKAFRRAGKPFATAATNSTPISHRANRPGGPQTRRSLRRPKTGPKAQNQIYLVA